MFCVLCFVFYLHWQAYFALDNMHAKNSYASENKTMKIMSKVGSLRGPIQETIVMALNNPSIQKKNNRSFS